MQLAKNQNSVASAIIKKSPQTYATEIVSDTRALSVSTVNSFDVQGQNSSFKLFFI